MCCKCFNLSRRCVYNNGCTFSLSFMDYTSYCHSRYVTKSLDCDIRECRLGIQISMEQIQMVQLPNNKCYAVTTNKCARQKHYTLIYSTTLHICMYFTHRSLMTQGRQKDREEYTKIVLRSRVSGHNSIFGIGDLGGEECIMSKSAELENFGRAIIWFRCLRILRLGALLPSQELEKRTRFF